MRKLQLERPICFFDLETTGINVLSDKIVSISAIKINPDYTTDRIYELINPGVSIPESASAIHGITTEMVQGKPYFKDLSVMISEFMEDCDFGGYNINQFDIPLLSLEFSRVDITFPKIDAKFVDVCNLYKLKNPRNLASAYKFYTKQNMEDAHNAEADNEATIEVLMGMLQAHDDLPLTVGEISKISDYDLKKVDIMGKFIYNEGGQYVYSFGKHKGERIGINNIGFIGWMLKPGMDFHPNTLMWAQKIYDEVIDSKF